MTTPEPSEAGKVSLEQLLRLKRAERPAPEFWACFEQDLRAKQLAAIVEKRPWWVALRLPLATRALSRWTVQLPLGAAAVLALSFVVVREDRPNAAVVTPAARVEVTAVVNATASLPQSAREVPSVAAHQPVAVPLPESVPPVVASLAPEVALKPEVERAQETTPVRAVAVASTNAPADRVAEVGLTLVAEDGVPALTPLPLGVVELSPVAFEGVASVESGPSFVAPFETEGLSIQWAQIRAEVGASRATPTSPREVRRKSILASLVLADNSTDGHRLTPGYAREVLTRPLSDEAAYDGMSRIGMGGDRLTLKF
jgi:hypothetical protein